MSIPGEEVFIKEVAEILKLIQFKKQEKEEKTAPHFLKKEEKALEKRNLRFKERLIWLPTSL